MTEPPVSQETDTTPEAPTALPDADQFAPEDAERAVARKAYDTVAGETSYPQDVMLAAQKLLASDAAPLTVGALVQWKPGLKQYVYPDYGRAMCYLGPRTQTRANIVFQDVRDELSDAYVGFIDGDRMFEVIVVDGRRLQSWIDPE